MTSVDTSDRHLLEVVAHPPAATRRASSTTAMVGADPGGTPRGHTSRAHLAPTQDTDPASAKDRSAPATSGHADSKDERSARSKHRRAPSSTQHTARRPTPTRHRSDRRKHRDDHHADQQHERHAGHHAHASRDKDLPRPRRLSQTEMVYPSAEAAKQAFDADRSRTRRAPTPYISHRPLPSQPSTTSLRSLRSKVSFDSGRSKSGGARNPRDHDSDADSEAESDDTFQQPQHEEGDNRSGADHAHRLGAWDPGFGATQGVGPAGEAIEYIGLGRKTPRHRTFQREMLKPALRSRAYTDTHLRNHAHQPWTNSAARGPLPVEPIPVYDLFRSDERMSGHRGGGLARHMSDMPRSGGSSHQMRDYRPPQGRQSNGLMRSHSRSGPHNPDSRPSLRSLFSSFTLDDPPFGSAGGGGGGSSKLSRSSSQMNRARPGRRAHGLVPAEPQLLHPAENLHFYLATAHIPAWRDWPHSASATSNSSRAPSGANNTHAGGPGGSSLLGLGGFGGAFAPLGPLGSLGKWLGMSKRRFGDMGWEWTRRFQLAEAERMNRVLRGWEAADRFWHRRVLEWCDGNVPSNEIAHENRWGKQIFALPAEEFDTLEYFDDQAVQAGDHGLLSWLTKSLLQTATSAMHMLRYSSQPFTFHVLPAPQPPHSVFSPFPREPYGGGAHNGSPSILDNGPAAGSSGGGNGGGSGPYLWEGFGTLVLVSKTDVTDRAMVIEVRPPDVLDAGVMRELAKGRREWWHLPTELCAGDVGQANLLQAQIYDDCVQNQVYFFAITNLKQWIFGIFDPTYTVAHVSPIIERKEREPSVMQCLVSWMVRSVDERPRAKDGSVVPLRPSIDSLNTAPPVPPYSQPRKGTGAPRHAYDAHVDGTQPYHTMPSHSVHPAQQYPSHFNADFGPSMGPQHNMNGGISHPSSGLPADPSGGMMSGAYNAAHSAYPYPTGPAVGGGGNGMAGMAHAHNHGLPSYFDVPPMNGHGGGGYGTWSGAAPGHAYNPGAGPGGFGNGQNGTWYGAGGGGGGAGGFQTWNGMR